MLRVWGATDLRPTRDIDLLGHVDNEIPLLTTIMKAACEVDVEEDGLRFDASTVIGERIKVDAEYQGVRITFTGFLGKSRIPMQIDIGFGDVVHPAPREQLYPTLLEFSAPRLRMYPRETLVAEKFEAMLSLGTTNSRMKDFFDIWLLSRQFDFAGATLSQAIAQTLANRGTEIESEPVALTQVFTASDAASKQWKAFVKRLELQAVPATLDEILRAAPPVPATAVASASPGRGVLTDLGGPGAMALK